MKILMVCLGNICRSPMAEGVLRHLAESRNLSIDLDSCGTAGYHIGSGPDYRAIGTMEKHGIDIEDLRARQFHLTDFSEFDLILTMDSNNYDDVVALTNSDQEAAKVKMILNYSYPRENMAVPDPYYGKDDGFENVFELLHDACSKLLDKLEQDLR
ncbi:MAG: protein-tyrosine phosphatase [Flavobacteriales bacterium]|jgi:protein-tyrosine phosphatase